MEVVEDVTIETRHSVCFPYPVTFVWFQCTDIHIYGVIVVNSWSHPIPLVLVSQLILKDWADAVGRPRGGVGSRQGRGGGRGYYWDQRTPLREIF